MMFFLNSSTSEKAIHIATSLSTENITHEVSSFYPTALKVCLGIVFTHSVQVGGRREKGCPGCISETVRCRKLILGRDIG